MPVAIKQDQEQILALTYLRFSSESAITLTAQLGLPGLPLPPAVHRVLEVNFFCLVLIVNILLSIVNRAFISRYLLFPKMIEEA